MTRSGNTTVPSEHASSQHPRRELSVLPAFVIIWSAHESDRCGEITFLGTNASWWLGRGVDESERVYFFRQCLDKMVEMGGLVGDSISRQQVRIRVSDGVVEIENLGSAKLRVNGHNVSKAVLAVGDVIEIRGHYAFAFVGRPTDISISSHVSAWEHDFGEPDQYGRG